MRINVYAEEMTHEVEIVRKDRFTGVRIYLRSPKELHHSEDDDDRSAITFWGKRDFEVVLRKVLSLLNPPGGIK